MVERHELNVTLVLLVALALVTVWVPPVLPSVLLRDGLVLALAVVKGRAIALRFLDLRSVPAPWRSLVMAWLGLVAVVAGAAAAIPHLL